VLIVATGSELELALDAATVARASGPRVRVVSMPSRELFDQQGPGLPRFGHPRIGQGAGDRRGRRDLRLARRRRRRRRDRGHRPLGYSAPAADAQRECGMTVDRVVEAIAQAAEQA
jgi:transketolase